MPVEFLQQEPSGGSGQITRLAMAYDGSGRRVSKTSMRKAGDGDWDTTLVTHYTGIGTEVREYKPTNFTSYTDSAGVEHCVSADPDYGGNASTACPLPDTVKVAVPLPRGLGRYALQDAATMDSSLQGAYEFYLKDHLGSTRMVYGVGYPDPLGLSPLGTVRAAYDYRSFGEQLDLLVFTRKVTENFTGKEKDDETELNYFGARYLDPMLGMWTSVDPARQFASPYLYAGNGMNPINVVDPDGNRVFGTYNRTTGEVYLVDENEKRGERSFFAISGLKNQRDDTEFGGPIPQGKYAIIEDPWNKRDNWFGLFYKDDERFDDYIQGGSSDGRGEFRFHRFINLSLGCVSAKTKTEEDYLKIYEWIKGTETQKVKDADGIWHIDYGEIEVISDDD